MNLLTTTNNADHLAGRQVYVKVTDADDYHPKCNVTKMASGIPLTDEDRWPWLLEMHQRAVRRFRDCPIVGRACDSVLPPSRSEGHADVSADAVIGPSTQMDDVTNIPSVECLVIACSALKARYREVLLFGQEGKLATPPSSQIPKTFIHIFYLRTPISLALHRTKLPRIMPDGTLHFFTGTPTMVANQYTVLEEPTAEECTRLSTIHATEVRLWAIPAPITSEEDMDTLAGEVSGSLHEATVALTSYLRQFMHS